MTLWSAKDLTEATGGTLVGSARDGATSAPVSATGVSIDTRTLVPGDLFVALIGDGRDGHAFVADALSKGAAAAMVHARTAEVTHTPAASGSLLHVDDTLAALTRLGQYARRRFATAATRQAASQLAKRVIAITGSVGKTTTKEMLRGALSAYGHTHAAVASYNNHWGVPLTLARLPPDASFCIAEIGMNHAGEIEPLARLVQPHVALITTIAKAHIGHLGSLEAIADEKASILRGLNPAGIAVLPADTDQLPRLRAAAGTAAILTFGTDPTADIRLLHAEPDADGSRIHVSIAGRTVSLRINAPGPHMAMNAVAALGVIAALGLDPAPAIAALEAFQPLSGRGRRRDLKIGGGFALLLDESYNGNGASMRSALQVLRLQPARRRIAILGDMLELGAEGPAEHAGLAAAAQDSADLVFTCGPLMRHLHDALPVALRGAHAPGSHALAPIAAAAIAEGDAILVKGSLGSGMQRVIQAIDAAYPDQPGSAPAHPKIASVSAGTSVSAGAG